MYLDNAAFMLKNEVLRRRMSVNGAIRRLTAIAAKAKDDRPGLSEWPAGFVWSDKESREVLANVGLRQCRRA